MLPVLLPVTLGVLAMSSTGYGVVVGVVVVGVTVWVSVTVTVSVGGLTQDEFVAVR